MLEKNGQTNPRYHVEADILNTTEDKNIFTHAETYKFDIEFYKLLRYPGNYTLDYACVGLSIPLHRTKYSVYVDISDLEYYVFTS